MRNKYNANFYEEDKYYNTNQNNVDENNLDNNRGRKHTKQKTSISEVEIGSDLSFDWNNLSDDLNGKRHSYNNLGSKNNKKKS